MALERGLLLPSHVRTALPSLVAGVVGVVAFAACHANGRGQLPTTMRCAPGRIGKVTVEGAPRASLAPLTVLEGTLDEPARTGRIVQLATEGLRSAGHAEATLDVTRVDGCGTELLATVVLGPKYTIDRIAFETDPEDELAERTRLAVIEDGLGTVNTIGGTYIAYRLERALKELTRRYADAGWVGAKIAPPRAAYDGRGHVTITIPVRSGPRFTIGTIRAIGAGASARATVLDALGLREGAYYDRTTVRAGVERAQRVLDRRIQLRVQIATDRAEIDVDAIVEAP